MKKGGQRFYEKIRGAKKILYLDLGFLGDTIHQIPALNCIREAFPEAELHVMVADHIKSIMEVVPWVDRVIGYPRFPKGPVWYKDIPRVLNLRKERYDVIINLNGSDRSSLLTWAIGAPVRLGRTHPKLPAFWKYCFTDTVTVQRGTMPIYRQSWQCLKEVGFPGEKPEFKVEVPEGVQEKVDELLEHEQGFIHISPFTTQDFRELPLPVLIGFINEINKTYPNLKLCLSCAPNERELSRFKKVLEGLDVAPWKVFGGTLSMVELVGLILRSGLHVGGDTGSIHIAFMVGAPTVSWFRHEPRHQAEWLPDGPEHRVLTGRVSPEGLTGISLGDLMGAFEGSLKRVS